MKNNRIQLPAVSKFLNMLYDKKTLKTRKRQKSTDSFVKQRIPMPGLSMNILRTGDKSLVQRGFFTNRTSDLLPTLGFLSGRYNFCNFVIVFSLM